MPKEIPSFVNTVLGKKMKRAIEIGIFSEYEAISIYLSLKYVILNDVKIGDFWNEDIERMLTKIGS